MSIIKHVTFQKIAAHDFRYDARIFIMDNKEIGSEGVNWIDLTQGRDRWRAVVSTVMNLLVP